MHLVSKISIYRVNNVLKYQITAKTSLVKHCGLLVQ